MLLSLGAGGVGLNLVGANHLFLLDMHWNPQLEAQACDRIYRQENLANNLTKNLIAILTKIVTKYDQKFDKKLDQLFNHKYDQNFDQNFNQKLTKN